jgi:transketolase C-terminal domain/subunit
VEDHNVRSGLGSQVALFAQQNHLKLDFFHAIGVDEYQLSGKSAELYAAAGIDHVAVWKILATI